jgi:tetratricopeptide (TPR) repeat protein
MIRTIVAAALIASAPAAIAQDSHAGHTPEPAAARASDPAGEGVGTEFMVFETGVEGAAHEHFLRGLALLHNFEYDRAAAAFRESQEADPDWVMPYWGEAMTHNHPLWEQQDREAALEILARLDPGREGRLAKTRSPREAAWLDAVETLYGTDGSGGSKEERDFLYLAKMRALLVRDPADIDARAFTGLAVLGTSHGGRDIALYMEAAGLLESGFMTHEQHPGILHYLIHSYDDPVHAPLGERMAERYARVAPGAGHAQHMISHIYNALGDWEASERANVLADGVVDRQRAAAGRDPADCGHYNEWLVYARLQQGKDASDIVSGCRATALKGDPVYGSLWSYATMAGWQAVDTGSWPDPLGEGADEFPLIRLKMAHIEALRHSEDAALLDETLAAMTQDLAALETSLAKWAPDDRTTMPWAERARAQVAALRVLASGDQPGGLAALRAAAEAESALPVVFGPPVIPKPSWELLGEKLLEAGRRDEAAEAFRRSLEFAPGRKLSIEGLAAATGQGG